MMTSLFSSFDPSSNILQMNWTMLISPLILLPMNFWMKKSRWLIYKKKMKNKIYNELMNSTNHKEMMYLSMSIMTMILMNNFLGLFPYIFTPTSHISISMSISLPLWTMLMIYGWMNFSNSMFKHLLPIGTPSAIMPMMIIIETTGNFIRPVSLSVRLTANMIAGHLLMTLLGDMNSIKMIMLIMPMQIMLILFESAISIIQAYVFSTLITLYSSEIP
uniref:ATP synthase F0 subunit 6 n=1 Tax=Pseudosymplanella nigrifasciata TaxID=2886261 RepID=UPI001E7632C9|nr:ATP synthase F0 subunit 6 [Pseudosymplanella nigrifasciata]UDL72062.1 ATP synthase F0 subunit 6 [Pseudosymplanella nigrifasciata]